MNSSAGGQSSGFTLIEILLAMVLASLIILGLSGVVSQTLHSASVIHAKNSITRDAHFALTEMTRALLTSPQLLLPLNDNPDTDWPENIREQTLPASPPSGSSTLASAVLAVTLAQHIDQDKNAIADADNDGDGLIDEDWGDDTSNDVKAGIAGIDDDGDGTIDEGSSNDDDEDGIADEDDVSGGDADNDGSLDEDSAADMNADQQSGVMGVDDDGDGLIDEASANDDDEDGSSDEDWLDPVVFYLNGSDLIKRMPVPWDVNSDGKQDGQDTVLSIIAAHVTRFRVERLPTTVGSLPLIDITLEISDPDSAQKISLNTRLRVGGAL